MTFIILLFLSSFLAILYALQINIFCCKIGRIDIILDFYPIQGAHRGGDVQCNLLKMLLFTWVFTLTARGSTLVVRI